MRILILGVILMISGLSLAQTINYSEDFEGMNLSMTSSSNSTSAWGLNSTFYSQGAKSDSCAYSFGDTIYLTSDAFSTSGSLLAYLEFDQICKIEFFDKAFVEVSNDNGTTWTQVSSNQYLGTGYTFPTGFNETSYTIWQAGVNATPNNSWWKTEQYDISSIAGNSTQARIRFVLIDANGSGNNGRYGWLLDNIKVWTPTPIEASALSFSLPGSTPFGCGLGNENISLKIINTGGTNISGNLTASYQRVGQSVVTENIPNTIIPGDTLDYTFNNLIDLSTLQDTNYAIKLWINLTGDPIQSNDTITDIIISRVALPLPSINDTTISFGTNVLLNATHDGILKWYSDSLGVNKINEGSSYTTPLLYDTTSYFLQAEQVIPASVSTTFASDNGATGNVFDIHANNTITIDSFYVNGTTDALMQVWYRPGSYVGYELSSTGWTLLGGDTLTNAVINTPTLLEVGGLTIPAGQTYGIIVTYQIGAIKYTNGNGSNLVYQDSNMIITNGHGGGYFNYTAASRVWNGTVFYHNGGPGYDAPCPSDMKKVTVNIDNIPVTDAGLSNISPQGILSPGTNSPIIVDLKNHGVDTLQNCIINYSIDDIVQPSIAWNGSLLKDSIASITLTNHNFVTGVYKIKAWTSSPNNGVDAGNHNDTISSTVFICLSGSLTLGSAEADFPDFSTFKNTLDNIGICGNTTINILPGTYTYQLTINYLAGLSSSSQLTLQSSTGNPDHVILQHTASTSADNYVIKLDSVKYVNLKHLTVKAKGITYGFGVHITNGSRNITVDSNIIIMESNASNCRGVVIATGATCSYNTITNNKILDGYYGIYTYASSSSLGLSNVIENNDIIGFKIYSAYNYYQKTMVFKGNKVVSELNANNSYGPRFYNSKGVQVIGNDIQLSGASNLYGFYITSCDSTPSVRTLVANNMVSMSGSGTHIGLYFRQGNGSDIAYNSIYNTGGNTSNYGLRVHLTGSSDGGNNVYNNNIHNTGAGYNFSVNGTSNVIKSDNNNIYGPNASDFAYWDGDCSNLTALKAKDATQNQNSISVDPDFFSASNLHTNSLALNGSALEISHIISTDFDGETRDSLTPDIGADEFVLYNQDAGIIALVSPINSCPGVANDIIVEIQNFGIDTLYNCQINWSIDGVVQTPYSFIDTIAFGETKNVNIGNHAFGSGPASQLVFWTNLPNGVIDLQTNNDTLSTVFKSSLPAGTYTVGVFPADYQDLLDVAYDLNRYGICGPVVFDIADGTYDGQFQLKDILGSSSANTITFKSASDDSSNVIISFDAGLQDSNYVIQLDKVNHITFKSLTIQSSASDKSRLIALKNKTNHLKVESCILENIQAISSSIADDQKNLVHTLDTLGNNIHFVNNAFINGNIALNLDGGVGAKSAWVIENNTFSSNAFESIKITRANACIIRNNSFFNPLVKINHHSAIHLIQSTGNIRVLQNKIDLSGIETCEGIVLNTCFGDSIAPILVANNFIRINQLFASNWTSGIQATITKYTNIYHNNILLTGSHSNSSCFFVDNTSTNETEHLNIVNNIFATKISGGSIFKLNNCLFSSFTNNYNNLYNSVPGFISGAITSLSAWQTTSGEAANSKTEDPYFASNSDLHVFNNLLNGAAIPLASITHDIDGELRDLTNPDMGADEFIPSLYDLTLSSVQSPLSSCNLGSNENVTVLLINIGASTINGNISLGYQINNSSSIIEAINDTILSGDSLYYTFNASADLDVTSIGADSLFYLKAWTSNINDPIKANDTSFAMINSYFTPMPPLVSNTNGNYGLSTTLTATSNHNISWFASDTAIAPIGIGNTFQTPLLYDTTQYWLNSSTVNCESYRVPMDVYINGYPTIDAGITDIVNPWMNVSHNTSEILSVRIHNYGLNNLTTAKVLWSLNGSIDSTVWNGNLAHGESDTLNLDTIIFLAGQYDFVSWTSLPNNITDTITSNDSSATFTFRVCLSGEYTIGDTIGGTYYDFAGFNDAINHLSAGGVCGNVTFKIASGLYDEQLILPSVTGADTNATITFTSLSGDSNSVILQYFLSGSTEWVVKIKGDHYQFSHLTINATLGNTYGQAIVLSDGAQYNTINNCVLEGKSVTASTTYYSVIYSTGGNTQYNTIKNNLILNGSYSVYFNGNSGNTQKRNIIEGNIIKGYYRYGPYLQYQKYLKLNSNIFESTIAPMSNGIYLRYSDEMEISKNKIIVEATTTHYGIYLYSCDGSSQNPSLIANNFVAVHGSGTSSGYGIRSYQNTYINFYNNSINVTGGNSSVSAHYQWGGSNHNVVNNVMSNTGGGYAYYVGTTSALINSDHNNLFASGSDLAYYQGDKSSLSALQSASGKDANSKDANPMFYTPSDLHSTSIDLFNAGTYLNSIVDDIDSEPRNLISPTIGADEFDIPPLDATIISINSPNSPVSGGSNAVIISLKNIGTDTLTSVNIDWEMNTIAQTGIIWTGSLAYGETDNSVNLGNFNFSSGVHKLKVWSSNPNLLTDANHQNDTLLSTLIACSSPMRGVYTIGGPSADFIQINDAILQLESCGVDSNVVLNIAAGTYNEQIELTQFTGTSDSATVTFQSATLDSTDVKIVFDAPPNDNYTVSLNGADWIRFKHVSIEATSSANGRAVTLKNGASNNIFEGNIITGMNGANSSFAAIYSHEGQENYNTFRSNRIQNGYYSIYMEGDNNSTKEKGLVFEGNIIEGFYTYGAYFEQVEDLKFHHNHITNGTASNYSYAIYLDRADGETEIYNNIIDLQTPSSSYGISLYDCDSDTSNQGKIYNNFIGAISNIGSTRGYYASNCTYQDFTNNNILVKSQGTNATGIRISSGQNNRIINNCLMLDGIGIAYRIDNTSAIEASDYNNIFTSGNQLVRYSGITYSNLNQYQNASNLDSNSISINPAYVSDFDLHVNGVNLNGNAMPLAWVNVDIDEEARNQLSPDIGADEFTPFQKDIASIEIISPNINHSLVGDTQTVTVRVKNFGTDSINSLNLGYIYANNTPVTQSWTGLLLPDSTLSITFNSTFNTLIGLEQLSVYAKLIGDQHEANDTIEFAISGLPVLTPNYCDDFEGQNIWMTTGEEWELGAPQGGSINTSHSGSNVWMTKLSGNYSNNANEYLYSPYFDFSNISSGSILKFWRNNIFAADEGMNIEYSIDDGITWITLGYWGDTLATNWYNGQFGGNHMFVNHSLGWIESTYDLSQFNQLSTPLQFRFHLYSNSFIVDEGIAIDDFCIELTYSQNDVGVVSIINPTDSVLAGTSTNQVSVIVKNYGANSQTMIPLNYTVNSGAVISDTLFVPSGLAQDSIMQFTFSQLYQAPTSNFNLCAYTSLATDSVLLNNEICKNITTYYNVDAALTQILNPVDTTILSIPVEVTVRIKNQGLLPFSSCDVSYTVNNNTPILETWSGISLSTGDSIDYTFNTKFNSPGGIYQLCAEVILTNDANSSNDEICKSLITNGITDNLLPGLILLQNFPNPFNHHTSIEYELPYGGKVKLIVYDALGNILTSFVDNVSSGKHQFEFNSSDFASGIYYYTLEFNGYRITKKMAIQR